MLRFIKQLTSKLLRCGGRNNRGRITVRHRGGGRKRLQRRVDFQRQLLGVPGRIIRLEPDRCRTAHLALVYYACGFFSYIIAPEGARLGDPIKTGISAWYPGLGARPRRLQVDIRRNGMALPLRSAPLGSHLYAVDIYARAAGCTVRLITRDFLMGSTTEGYALLKLPSGATKYLPLDCVAVVGVASNKGWKSRSLRKAGSARGRGCRPHVRGVAMNPVDHPHGGGEGKSSGGRQTSLTPWGKLTKGGRTRKPHVRRRTARALHRIKEKIKISRAHARLQSLQ